MRSKGSITRVCEQCGKSFLTWPSKVKIKNYARFCSKPCRGKNRRIPANERFWDKVNKQGPIPPHRQDLGPCWEWIRATTNGYGVLGLSGLRGNVQAHRFSWELKNGPIPEGLYCLHHCDNRRCVNPDHLFLGSQQDNIDDMMQKARNRPPRVKGEQSGRAKLTESDVRAIRSRYATGKVLQKELADEYGITQAVISAIVLRKIWKHIG